MSLFPSLTTVSVVATNAFLVSFKYPLVFLTVILGLSYFFGNGSLIFEDMISVLDLLYPVKKQNQSQILIVMYLIFKRTGDLNEY